MVRSDAESVKQGVAGEQLETLDADSENEEPAEPSREVRRYDLETMMAEEEADTLLEKSTSGSRKMSRLTGNDREPPHARRPDRGSKRRRKSEKAESMYEMEEGGPRSSSAAGSSEHSGEIDLARLHEVQSRRKVTFEICKRRNRWMCVSALTVYSRRAPLCANSSQYTC